MALPTRYKWDLYPPLNTKVLEELAGFGRILPVLLWNRGITNFRDAEKFLKQAGSVYDPFGIADMDVAVAAILKAVEEGTHIAVYGDYDVDGVTATTILVQLLRKLENEAIGYIPNRFDEGYGLNKEALKKLKDDGISLIITVDCGIRSVEDAAFARSIGLEMIISDHHEPGPEIPDALAVICPKKPGDTYPNKDLAGVGLAYKIAEAVLEKRPTTGIEAQDWIDLAAIGTIADIVPLSPENRSLVKAGLRKMRTEPRPAIQALSNVANFSISSIRATTIGFTIGPRLNASGRLKTAELSFDLLKSETLAEAKVFAEQLEEQNKQRQDKTRETQTKAVENIDRDNLPYVILARDADFNMGVVGLAASKLTESFYRPSIVGTINEETTRASCRSIPEFNIIEALDKCSDLMVKYGGHAMAAGLTVKNENWDKLNERLNQLASEQLGSLDLQPVRRADMEVELDYLTKDVLSMIDDLEPFGQGNPVPVFIVKNLHVKGHKQVGLDGKHLKLTLASDTNYSMDAIAFSQGEWAVQLPEKLDVLATLEKNSWRERETLQLQVMDIRLSTPCA